MTSPHFYRRESGATEAELLPAVQWRSVVGPQVRGDWDYRRRWSRLLTQQTSCTICRLPTKENKIPFSISVCSKPTEVCRFRFPCIYICTENGNIYIFIKYTCTYTEIYYISIDIYMYCRFKRNMEAYALFLNPFAVRSSYKRKFVVCPCVYEVTDGSYPFANGLNGLAHLWLPVPM